MSTMYVLAALCVLLAGVVAVLSVRNRRLEGENFELDAFLTEAYEQLDALQGDYNILESGYISMLEEKYDAH